MVERRGDSCFWGKVLNLNDNRLFYRAVRDLVVVALSLMIILGLFLFERFYFSYGQKEFSDETVAWLQDLYLSQVLPVEPVSIQGQLCSESVAVIGHRGSVVDGQFADSDRMNLRNTKIGNTKLGIERALRAKIDFIEIDLRIFSGSEKDLVLYHDSNLGKLEDPTGLLKLEGRRIEELSYNEIDDLTYRILGTEDQDIDRSVLFFSEFLEGVADSNQKIILDLKFAKLMGPAEFTEAFEKMLFQLKKHKISRERVLFFGDFIVLTEWHKFVATRTSTGNFRSSECRLGYTVLGKHFENRFDVLIRPSRVFENLSQLQMPGVKKPVLVLPVSFASNAMLSRAEQREVDVWIYDTEDFRDWRGLEKRGVDGFILDVPKAYSK